MNPKLDLPTNFLVSTVQRSCLINYKTFWGSIWINFEINFCFVSFSRVGISSYRCGSIIGSISSSGVPPPVYVYPSPAWRTEEQIISVF